MSERSSVGGHGREGGCGVAAPESGHPGTDRRPPTAAEARALGHPLRLRILFACRDRPRTNKELADALDSNPGTVHYHVRQLLDQDFLSAEPARPGPRGSREQPYRSTGKSWRIGYSPDAAPALRQAGAEELLSTRNEDMLELTRLGLSLSDAEVAELLGRLHALAEEFAARSRTSPERLDEAPGAGIESVTLLMALFRPGQQPDP